MVSAQWLGLSNEPIISTIIVFLSIVLNFFCRMEFLGLRNWWMKSWCYTRTWLCHGHTHSCHAPSQPTSGILPSHTCNQSTHQASNTPAPHSFLVGPSFHTDGLSPLTPFRSLLSSLADLRTLVCFPGSPSSVSFSVKELCWNKSLITFWSVLVRSFKTHGKLWKIWKGVYSPCFWNFYNTF